MPQSGSALPVTRQDFLVDQSLEAAISDPDTIRSIRPVVPQQLFPETRGFAKTERGVLDVLGIDRAVPSYRSWVSGAPVMMHADGTLKNDLIQAGGRYSMEGVFPS